MNVLVIGATGLIGSAMFKTLTQSDRFRVTGVVRSAELFGNPKGYLSGKLIECKNLLDPEEQKFMLEKVEPAVVINCAGITKHEMHKHDIESVLDLNSKFPHSMSTLCQTHSSRFIQISTDCVFLGDRGRYTEECEPDAVDLYGRSKITGEVSGPGILTLRTSTIGHEIKTKNGLLEWFLSQRTCAGFTKAIFSGLPSNVFARVVRDYVMPNNNLSGLYHVGGPSISKFDLLKTINRVYDAGIEITPDETFVIDRSLDSELFRMKTGYVAPGWDDLVRDMHSIQ